MLHKLSTQRMISLMSIMQMIQQGSITLAAHDSKLYDLTSWFNKVLYYLHFATFFFSYSANRQFSSFQEAILGCSLQFRTSLITRVSRQRNPKRSSSQLLVVGFTARMAWNLRFVYFREGSKNINMNESFAHLVFEVRFISHFTDSHRFASVTQLPNPFWWQNKVKSPSVFCFKL